MGSILSIEHDEEDHDDEVIPCPYVRHGCDMKELTGKELEKHINDAALHHLQLCEEFLTSDNKDKVETANLRKDMQQKLDHVGYVSGCVDRIVASLEEVRTDQLELAKKVFMDSLSPFHEISEHVKELEKFVHRVEYFVEMVNEHMQKFDKKSMLELSLPRVSDPTTYSHPLRSCKISVSDSVRFDKDRIYGHYLKMSKKISTLKSMHYNSVIVARDVVEKLQKRDEIDLETPFTEVGLLRMQTSFGIKADSFLDILDDSYNSISSSYRQLLIDFINSPDKDHLYTDYHIWKVVASRLTKDNVSKYYKDEHSGGVPLRGGLEGMEMESDLENSFSIWATEDVANITSGQTVNAMIVVEYTIQIRNKGDISGGVFLYNQHKLERVAPSKVFISRMKIEGEGGVIFSVMAEFPFEDIESGCLVDDTLYFNTVIA